MQRHSALLRPPEHWDERPERRLAAQAQPVEPVQLEQAAQQGSAGCALAACQRAGSVLRRRAAWPDVPRDALRAVECRRVRRWARLTALRRQVACLLVHPGVLHDALHAEANPQAESLPRAERRAAAG